MPKSMNQKQPTIISLGLEALRRLFADEAIPLAGNIAFRTLFSIFPFLIFSLIKYVIFQQAQALLHIIIDDLLVSISSS